LPEDLLNPYQRNSVAITLRMVETALREALAELGRKDEGILYRRSGTLSEEQTQQIQRVVEAALQEIESLAQSLDLPVEVHDNRAALLGKLSVLWIDLHEIRAQSLKGYGEVAPGLKAVLDPPVSRLIELVAALSSLL